MPKQKCQKCGKIWNGLESNRDRHLLPYDDLFSQKIEQISDGEVFVV